MSPVDVLLWIVAAFGALILLAVIAFLVVLVWAAVVGLGRMRADETESETRIYEGRGDR